MFDLAEVERGLGGAWREGSESSIFAGTVVHVRATGSTNTLALEAAARGVEVGVWVADEQTAGRGRGGHTWVSQAGDGLYVSLLMRPKLRGSDVLKLSLTTGVAVGVAIDRATAALITLRWPNDLMDGMQGKKLGGILIETAIGGDGALQYAVIGIGINLNQPEMPEELQEIATSLRKAWFGEETRREMLLPLLLREVEFGVRLLEKEAAGEPTAYRLKARFEDWSPMVRGVRVRVAEEGGYTGVTDGLEETGLLRVRLEDGTVRVVRHGGVRAV